MGQSGTGCGYFLLSKDLLYSESKSILCEIFKIATEIELLEENISILKIGLSKKIKEYNYIKRVSNIIAKKSFLTNQTLQAIHPNRNIRKGFDLFPSLFKKLFLKAMDTCGEEHPPKASLHGHQVN